MKSELQPQQSHPQHWGMCHPRYLQLWQVRYQCFHAFPMLQSARAEQPLCCSCLCRSCSANSRWMLKIPSEGRMCCNMLLYSVLELMPCCRAAAYVICANPKCMNNKYSNSVLMPYVQIHFQGSMCCGVVEVARMGYSGL